MSEHAPLTGTTALVTGASSGIGEATARHLASLGADVSLVARRFDRIEALAQEVRGTGRRAVVIEADVTDRAQAEAAVQHTVDQLGRLDTLVNNAGDGGPTRPIQDYTTEDWFYTVNSCLTSAYMCSRFVVPEMMACGRGAIVNIASMAGRRGLMYRVGYCAAKAGQIGMTYGLALELGRHNITVNAIAPGAVAGDRIDRVIQGQAEVRGVDVERMRKSFVERSPLQRMSTAEDIASLAAFLCSDGARNLSGQCIPVTAGEPAS
jgi:NAD(P)-dependent dehydrogenase (short-subunit alcohol dehydrogenase family)